MSEVEDIVAQVITAARAKLLAWPTKLAGKGQYVDELPVNEGYLRDGVYDALNELSECIYNVGDCCTHHHDMDGRDIQSKNA